jgi:hypothetical protein
MPFKSKAQRRKFAELLVKGEITPETFEEWNRETGGAKLPERVSKKSSRKKAGRKKSTRRAKTTGRAKTTRPKAKTRTRRKTPKR